MPIWIAMTRRPIVTLTCKPIFSAVTAHLRKSE